MSKFIFTPGQIEEAMMYIRENCKELWDFLENNDVISEDYFIDMYYRLKGFNADLKPEEFIIGVEYKDKQAVIDGTEKVSLRFINPRRDGVKKDPFAEQIMIELLNRLKG